MHQETLKQVVDEIAGVLPGQFLGRLFQLSSLSLAMDVGLKDRRFLFVSVEPASPRLYLIKRTPRELEKASQHPAVFVQTVRSLLAGSKLLVVEKDAEERIVRFKFEGAVDAGTPEVTLVAQLTGRSANLMLLDAEGIIRHTWRPPQGEGQQVGEAYRPPPKSDLGSSSRAGPSDFPLHTSTDSDSISQIADSYFRKLDAESAFQAKAASLRAKLRSELAKTKKLKANLEKDLATHGSPESHKRLGDLLLANIANAKRDGAKVTLIDYYAEGAPAIQIKVDENVTLQEAANDYFVRYTKAKRAAEEIETRLSGINCELTELAEREVELQKAISTGEWSALAEFDGQPKPAPAKLSKKQKASPTLPGIRRYRSSDGYEVLVGRTARDNDQLTFRVARPNDLWLHAGDYPGSHVIVRNSSRSVIPHRTVVEAAQLAAKFSQASKDLKVVIHYTRRKFLTKPKGAAPGLVRMSTFKSVTVEPAENLERIR